MTKELSECGGTLLQADTLVEGTESVKEVLSQATRLALLGSAKTQCTTLQLYQLLVEGLPTIYVQPQQGSTDLLPGEFHTRFVGNLRSPACFYRKSLLSKRWAAAEDLETEQHLNSSAPLKKATGAMKWRTNNAASYIDLDWTIQLRALGDGTSHLVVQSAGFGRIGWRAGVTEFAAIVRALLTLVEETPHSAQGLYYEDCYWELFDHVEQNWQFD